MSHLQRLPLRSVRIVGILLLVALSSSPSLSQIPNGGFELWEMDPDTNFNPMGWQTTNSYPLVNVERYTPGCEGNYAMKVKTVNVSGFPFPGVAILEAATNFSQLPTRLSVCFKSTIMPGDQAFIIVGLLSGDSVVALPDSCTFRIGSTTGQFTYREFPLILHSTLVPDSLIIIVASGLGFGQVGTELIVDDLAFRTGPASVSGKELLPRSVSLHQNYPNPFNPTTAISYELPVRTHVSLKVFDLLGRDVATLVNETREPGTNTVQFHASGLASGVYFYTLRAGSFSATRMLMLLR